jgi:RecA/RadA recombinase
MTATSDRARQQKIGFGKTISIVPLKKKPTGITGFDDISRGGLPEARIVGVAGTTGNGETVFAL